MEADMKLSKTKRRILSVQGVSSNSQYNSQVEAEAKMDDLNLNDFSRFRLLLRTQSYCWRRTISASLFQPCTELWPLARFSFSLSFLSCLFLGRRLPPSPLARKSATGMALEGSFFLGTRLSGCRSSSSIWVSAEGRHWPPSIATWAAVTMVSPPSSGLYLQYTIWVCATLWCTLLPRWQSCVSCLGRQGLYFWNLRPHTLPWHGNGKLSIDKTAQCTARRFDIHKIICDWADTCSYSTYVWSPCEKLHSIAPLLVMEAYPVWSFVGYSSKACLLAAAVMTEPGGPLLLSSPFNLGAMLATSHTLGCSAILYSTVFVKGCRDRWKGFASCLVASGRRKSGCFVLVMISRGGGKSSGLGPIIQKLKTV